MNFDAARSALKNHFECARRWGCVENRWLSIRETSNELFWTEKYIRNGLAGVPLIIHIAQD
jgi:hypothetical protein